VQEKQVAQTGERKRVLAWRMRELSRDRRWEPAAEERGDCSLDCASVYGQTRRSSSLQPHRDVCNACNVVVWSPGRLWHAHPDVIAIRVKLERSASPTLRWAGVCADQLYTVRTFERRLPDEVALHVVFPISAEMSGSRRLAALHRLGAGQVDVSPSLRTPRLPNSLGGWPAVQPWNGLCSRLSTRLGS
jgi:hypothetical protein